ncbi:aminotransferase [Raoultibacter phocaeensis]|uniref:aminotransferase n=1 Tax=Raoultibacter phocaeensis TaxID=2479841 RepID=UPI0011192A7E|nr:aminotransferase [Raoultibacter phocaeensis]
MKIRDFGVEIWMNAYENDCEYNLAETCVKSLTVQELVDLAEKGESAWDDIRSMQLTYGAIEGSDRLRTGISGLYNTMGLENITITHGAIGANDLVLNALVEPGDRVISVLPTYQQLYSIPESLGAEVKICQLSPENGFMPDLDEMRTYANDGMKLICVNNPNNPSGAVMSEEFMRKIVEIARGHDAWLLCDEAYRGLNHAPYGENFSPAMADLYEKGVSVGSFSKTFSLAGLRLGWVAGPRDLIERISRRRDYNTISCGMIDDYLATLAIENREALLRRNLAIVEANAAVLDAWVHQEPRITYVKPAAGTTAFLKYDAPLDSVEFCKRLLDETGVMLLPGSAMDREGWLRIGYCFAEDTSQLSTGLKLVSKFLRQFD